MLYTLFEIIISALAVYGGWRLIKDISALYSPSREKKTGKNIPRKNTDGQGDIPARPLGSERDRGHR